MSGVIPSSYAVRSFNPLDPIGSILDNALDSITKSVDSLVNRTHDAGVDIILQAGEQAARVIASLKASYDDSLNKTYEAADKLIRENIDRVDDLVKDIVHEEQQALLKVADRIADIVKFSPLSNWWLPLLSDVSPEFFAVALDPVDDHPTITAVLITFTGNFAYADRAGCTPTYTLNKVDYNPSSNTTKELKFLVNISSDTPALSKHKYTLLTDGVLKVTWKYGLLPWQWTTSEYKTLLGMLPASPGKITVTYATPESAMRKNYAAPLFDVWKNGSEWLTARKSFGPEAGWHLVDGSATVHLTNTVGSQINAEIERQDHDEVVCKYSRKDGSGKVQVFFDEVASTPGSSRQEIRDDLGWGSSWVVKPNGNEKISSIVFQSFNGDTIQFQARTDNSNPFIKLREFDGSIQFTASRAKDINDSNIVNIMRALNRKQMADNRAATGV